MARIQRSVVISDKAPERPKPLPFRENDIVTIGRDLKLGTQHIPDGSKGVVTVVRSQGRLCDIKFFCDPSSAITISKLDLRLAARA